MKQFTVSNPRPKLSAFLTDKADTEFSEEKCWQCKVMNEFDDILAHLKYLKFKIVNTFGIFRDDTKFCTHILAKSSHGHEVIIKVDNIECTSIIELIETDSSVVPSSVAIHFKKHMSMAYTDYCFLTHHGIDTISGDKDKYLFHNAERDLQKLKRGRKFYLCLPYVKYENLASVGEANDLYTFISENKDTGEFMKLVCKSGNINVLTAKGPFTVFAPSNDSLKKKFGDIALSDIDPERSGKIALNHIFPGSHDESFTGQSRNLAGNTVRFSNGVPMIENSMLNAKGRSYKKSNGIVRVLDDVINIETSQTTKINIDFNSSISDASIAVTTYYSWKAQNLLDQIEIKSLREQIQILSKCLNEHEQETIRLDETGRTLLRLNDRYRDNLHLADVEITDDSNDMVLSSRKTELDDIQSNISRLSDKYYEHIKTGAKISAISQLVTPYIKEARDA